MSSSTFTSDDNDRWERHLDWSAQQGRILTAEGKASDYYNAERGFAFVESELPHYYLMKQQQREQEQNNKKTIPEEHVNKKQKKVLDDWSTHAVFRQWRNKQTNDPPSPVVGVWQRTLFYGGWEHTTNQNETVFNVQTPTLFIDLRLPTTRLTRLDRPDVKSWQDLEATDLRRMARQHVFGGYTVVQATTNKPSYPLVCTRHHVMDWNFVGTPRPRPNKWYVEMNHAQTKWKEWAFATDDHGQQYYCEHWETLLHDNTKQEQLHQQPIVALRKSNVQSDGILLIVGTHFSYLLDDRTAQVNAMGLQPEAVGSLVDTVDACIAQGNLEGARAWLSLRGGHGRIGAQGWKIDAATEFWKEGQCLFATHNEIPMVVNGCTESWKDDAHVLWKGDCWEIFECNLLAAKELQDLFCQGVSVLPR